MTIAETLQALRALPDEAEVTLSVKVADLRTALEDQDLNPDRIVTTVWCEEKLGMSREWWAEECRSKRIRDAFQETKGAPWNLPAGVARTHLQQYRASRTPSRSRRRGPRSQRRTQ